jgi:hypothetical protein
VKLLVDRRARLDITTNCGTRVEHLDVERAWELSAELES